MINESVGLTVLLSIHVLMTGVKYADDCELLSPENTTNLFYHLEAKHPSQFSKITLKKASTDVPGV